jgi:hypothetical protein
MSGHIALGNVGALRDYMIQNTNLYSKSPANQFAAKLATGAGDYDDLQNWSYWVQDNWQMGVGQKDAEGGGFLYGECETRYPEQIFLPRHLKLEMQDAGFVSDVAASIVSGETTIGTAETFRRWAMQIGGGTGRVLDAIWVYLKNNGETFTVRLSADSAGEPGASVTTCTVTSSDTTPGYGWYKASTINQNITSSAYWISLEVVSSGTLPELSDSVGGPTAAYYDGAAWISTTSIFGLLLSASAYGDSGEVPLGEVQMVEFNEELYVINSYDARLFKRTASSPGWVEAGAGLNGAAGQILRAGDILVVAIPGADSQWMDTTENLVNMSTPDTTGTGSFEVTVWALWNGFLWAAYGNNVYYTGDYDLSSATWTGPIQVSPPGNPITGMAGLGDYLYVSTEDDLAYVGFGDFVFTVTTWGSPSADNGRKMIQYQGQLFIPVQESLLRYDGSNMLPIGIDLGEGLPPQLQGNVSALASTNNWLLMAVDPRDGTTQGGTVWAWTTQGWHNLAHLPPTISPTCL